MANLHAYYASIGTATGVGAQLALREIGIQLRNIIVRDLSRSGSGVVYHGHRASAPGQAPATDTGSYKNSWNFQVSTNRFGGEAAVGTGDKRGPWLEFGTRRMAARPHLRPAVQGFTSSIQGIVRKHVESEVRAAAGKVKKIELPVIHVSSK